MNLGAFALIQGRGTRLEEVRGLAKERPFAAIAMALFLLSLVGIPPLAGFAGKFLLFTAALEADYAWIVIVAIINSVISLAVYLRIIFPMFYSKDTNSDTSRSSRSSLIKMVYITCFSITLIMGIFVRWILVY